MSVTRLTTKQIEALKLVEELTGQRNNFGGDKQALYSWLAPYRWNSKNQKWEKRPGYEK